MMMNMIVQSQYQAMSNPKSTALVSPVNLYNALNDQVKVHSKSSSGRYFTDPNNPQFQQAMMQQQQQAQMLQAKEIELREREIALQEQKVFGDVQRKQDQTKVDWAQLEQDADQHNDTTALKYTEMQMEYELEKEQERGVEIG